MKHLLFMLLFVHASAMVVLAAPSESAEQKLNQALQNLDNITADFEQTVLDDDNTVVQQSRGKLAIQRPGKFSWIYTAPYEQQIIADGSELWIYDVDLDQVTVKPMDTGLATAPIMVLMKQNEITGEFTVHEVGQRRSLYWVELRSKVQDMDYSRVYIGLDGDRVKAMALHDNFGQSTQIVFDNLQLDVVHDPQTFQFVPPEGVDVFGVGS